MDLVNAGLVFHEKQDGQVMKAFVGFCQIVSSRLYAKDAFCRQLCAQHALNSLLQGPYFTAVDLSSIAQDLDDKELQVCRGATSDTI
jgi:hypothetical protein